MGSQGRLKGTVIGGGHAIRNSFVHDDDIGVTVKYLDHLLVRYEPAEMAVIGVGTPSRLAGCVQYAPFRYRARN